jgi:hypothetical protein
MKGILRVFAMSCALVTPDSSSAYPSSTLRRPTSSVSEEADRADRKVCPWDEWRAYALLFDPPAPTGDVNPVWLPNIANPGAELSLTVAGEDDKYPMTVEAGGFGGRLVTCSMPNPERDNDAMMGRLGPVCPLSEPPLMECPVFDAWFEGAPGGPLHDLIHAGVLSPEGAHDTNNNKGSDAVPATSTMPKGAAALKAAVKLLADFKEAERLVGLAQWEVDVFRQETKKADESAKDMVAFAKTRKGFWDADCWGPPPRVLPSGLPYGLGGGLLGRCFEEHDAWLNSSLAAEASVKKQRKVCVTITCPQHDATSRN